MLTSLQNKASGENVASQHKPALRVASRHAIGTWTATSFLQMQEENKYKTRLKVISGKTGNTQKYNAQKNTLKRQLSKTSDLAGLFEIHPNQFQSRESGQQNFNSTATTAALTLASSNDETGYSFLQKLNSMLIPCIDETDLNVGRICTLIKMSKTNLFIKLKAATGLSISLYVRKLKLIRGKQMLLTTQLTISEIAYQIGFNDPKYFTRVFSAEFGISPKEMRERG